MYKSVIKFSKYIKDTNRSVIFYFSSLIFLKIGLTLAILELFE